MQPEPKGAAPHGSYAALQVHKVANEKPCALCLRAGALYMKAYRERDKCAPGLGWPLRSIPVRRARRQRREEAA